MKRLIYLAGPIRKGNQWHNGAQADDAMIVLMKAGVAVVNPMLSMWVGACRSCVDNYGDLSESEDGRMWIRPSAKAHGDFQSLTHEDWLEMDKEIIRRCDAVLRLPGESVGADDEVVCAERNGIPVFHDVEEVIRWATV